MLARKFAAVAVAASLLVSATACSFNPNPESLQSYAPSDGSGADLALGNGQGLKLRNFVYLTNGTDGALIGVIVNQGSEEQTVTLNYNPTDGEAQSETVVIGAFAKYSFGFDSQPASTLALPGKAGQVVEISFGAADNSQWVKLSIPVLDSTFDYYRSIVDDLANFKNVPVTCESAEPASSASASAEPSASATDVVAPDESCSPSATPEPSATN